MHTNPHTKEPASNSVSEEWRDTDIANPTEEHKMLREMVRNFVSDRVEPQALESDRNETFNLDLFREMGEMGLRTDSPSEYGGRNGLYSGGHSERRTVILGSRTMFGILGP